MTTFERTILFNICVIIYNILLGLVIETVIFVLYLLFIALTKNQNLGESVYIQIALPVMMLLGLILAIFISTKTVAWFIQKRHLEDKLSQKVIEHYKKDDAGTTK